MSLPSLVLSVTQTSCCLSCLGEAVFGVISLGGYAFSPIVSQPSVLALKGSRAKDLCYSVVEVVTRPNRLNAAMQ